jgi:predicted nucleic acid-binding protein
LFDTNVLLDVFAHREPHYTHSAAMWELAETGEIIGLAAAHSFTTLHYLFSRQASKDAATLAIQKLLRVFGVAAVDQNVIASALGYGWADFEDAVQMAAAEASNCDYLVTRNPKDYNPSAITVISPVELLAIVSPSEN